MHKPYPHPSRIKGREEDKIILSKREPTMRKKGLYVFSCFSLRASAGDFEKFLHLHNPFSVIN
jgi:hypothetical protein